MTGEQKKLLCDLSNVFGPSGCECRVAELLAKALSGICETKTDRMGNLICTLKGKKGSLCLCAPMDECGFMVTDIDDKGYVRVSPVGNADPACFLAKRFTLGNESTTVHGVGGGKVLHLLSGGERTDSPNIDKLFIDLGYEKKEEVEKLIGKGDLVAYEGAFFELPGGYTVGKALDARVPCFLAAETLKAAARRDESDRPALTVIFAVKEKAGISGAVTAAYNEAPGDMILLSFAPSCDLPGTDEMKKGAILGGGPVLPFKDGRVLFYDSPLFAEVRETAKKKKLPLQLLDAQTSVSAGKAHLSREGIRMARVDIPVWNPETDAVIVAERDVDAALALLTALTERS